MTTPRNLDPYTFFEQLARQHKPSCRFTGKTAADFRTWQRRTLPKVLATLGKAPEKAPPRPELVVEWNEDGLIKQRWLIDTQPGLSAAMYVFRPADLARGEKRPAILCCHGHGTFGKDSVMGLATNPDRAAEIERCNYDYGRRMAMAGFVTYAIDLLGFGERDQARKPHQRNHVGQRDKCNIQYLCATMLGTTPLALNCHDHSAATDFVCSLPFVDANRLGVMGLSQGGTSTTWQALYDKRMKAVDIICYAGSWVDIAYRTYNVCGSQVTPGIFSLVDVGDLQGLIAPRPLLIELGIHDECFEIDHTLDNYLRIESIYKAAGALNRLELDLFPKNHQWGANRSVEFFRKYLGGGA